MKVLVTGGAGFIGSHIVDALIKQGHDVAVVDSLATGSLDNVNPRAKFYKVSICDDTELGDVFDREKPDVVNHQAAQTVVTRSVADPVFDARENILGSLNVLVNCARLKVKRIIYASSGGAVYGEPQYLPVDEDHPVKPLSPYGISKHTIEHYLYQYGLSGLTYVVLRYSNVFGSRQSPLGEAGVVAIFARQMLGGEQPTIFGPGDKTRDYTHVFDVVSANLLAMERGDNSTYNIGTGVEISDQRMFDTLAGMLGYPGKPLYAPLRMGEVYRICLNADRARKELGWQARVSFEEGLSEAVNYYKRAFGN